MRRRVPQRARLVAFLPLLLSGCYSPELRNGGLLCSEGSCPEGYYCAADTGHCWRNGTVPPLEGPPEDTGRPPPDAGMPDVPNLPNLDAESEVPSSPPDAEPPEPDVPPDPLAYLSGLTVQPGALEPAFAPNIQRYDLNLPLFTPALTVTATSENPLAELSFNFAPVKRGTVMSSLPLAPGPSRVSIEVTAGMARSTYRIAVNTGGEITYAKPSNTHAGMAFGTAVAISGNYLVVGAPAEKSLVPGPQTGEAPPTGDETGAAYVYSRSGTSWKREVMLKPAHLNPAMKFGASVAIAGDVIVVGAPGETGDGTGVNPPFMAGKASDAGAAFVFGRTPTGQWVQQAYLKASDTATGDQFGWSVAVSPSGVAGVQQTTVAVGAPGAGGPGGAPRTGAVYVFVRPANGVFAQQGMPRVANPKGNNEFGTSLSLSGETLVVGAPREDSGASGVNPGSTSATAGNSGAAYIFTRNGTAWPAPIYVKAPVAVPGAAFGSYVAVALPFLAVAAPLDPGSWRGIDPMVQGPATGHGSGAVFLYHRTGNTWSLLHQIKPMTPHNFDSFGRGLGLSATTLVVGAPFDDTNEAGIIDPNLMESGAIYVFRPRDAGIWQQLVRLKAPNAELNDQFGIAVATDGDTVVAGADGEDSAAVNVDGRLSDNGALGSGAVYLY